MKAQWSLITWWELLEVETILRNLIVLETVLIVVASIVLTGWYLWVTARERHARKMLDRRLVMLNKYIFENGPEPHGLNWLSTFLLVQLIHELDKIIVVTPEHIKRKVEVRQYIMASTLHKRIPGLAKSRFSGRRAIAVICIRLAPRPEDEIYLLKLIKDNIPLVKLGAARLILKIGSQNALEAIIEFLTYEKRFVRNLIELSVKETSPAFIDRIRSRLKKEKDPFIQKLCLDLFGTRLDDQSDGDLVFSMASSDYKNLRITAIRALSHSRCRRAYEALCNSIKDKEWEVRAAACRLMGEYNHSEGVPLLVAAAKDESWWVRRNSTSALAQLGEIGEAALKNLVQQKDRFASETAELALRSTSASKKVTA